MRGYEWMMQLLKAIVEMQFLFGIDAYIILMIFILATIGLAKIILKTCTKQNFKYSNLLLFCTIGLILAIILKIIFNLNFQKKILEVFICLILNIIIFIIFKHKDKILYK